MTDEALNELFDACEWTPYDGPAGIGSMLHATHIGCVEVNGCDLRCYKLNDGSRVLDAADVVDMLRAIMPAMI
jgi:hypothetical protein